MLILDRDFTWCHEDILLSRDSCTIRKKQNKAGIAEFRTTFSYSLKILVATRRAVRGADQDKTSRLKNDHAKLERVLAISLNP
jgi:hypothetical protein